MALSYSNLDLSPVANGLVIVAACVDGFDFLFAELHSALHGLIVTTLDNSALRRECLEGVAGGGSSRSGRGCGFGGFMMAGVAIDTRCFISCMNKLTSKFCLLRVRLPMKRICGL